MIPIKHFINFHQFGKYEGLITIENLSSTSSNVNTQCFWYE